MTGAIIDGDVRQAWRCRPLGTSDMGVRKRPHSPLQTGEGAAVAADEVQKRLIHSRRTEPYGSVCRPLGRGG